MYLIRVPSILIPDDSNLKFKLLTFETCAKEFACTSFEANSAGTIKTLVYGYYKYKWLGTIIFYMRFDSAVIPIHLFVFKLVRMSSRRAASLVFVDVDVFVH